MIFPPPPRALLWIEEVKPMTLIKRAETIFLEGVGSVKITPQDHIATGGEGAVYGKKNFVIKLYLDSRRMMDNGFIQKLRLLSQISHPSIVAPRGLVIDKRKKPIGFFMSAVKAQPLSPFFTSSFWKRENFGIKDASVLVDKMREVVNEAHTNGAVMADANEFNWLVDFRPGKKASPYVFPQNYHS